VSDAPPVRRRGRLVLRIYLYTSLSVLLAAILFVALVAVTFPPPPIGRRAPPAWPNGPGLTFYDADHRLIGIAAESAMAPVDAAQLDRLRRGERFLVRTGVTGLPLFREGQLTGYLLMQRPPPPFGLPTLPLEPFLVAIAVLIGVISVGSVLFARHLARPLQQLERAAGAFGAGDHEVRVRLARRDEIGRVGKAFDDMADRVTQLVRSQKELMANVSHELRTPLSRIRVALDLAAEGNAQTSREVIAEIDQDLNELEGLVNDVLTSMRLDLAQAPLRLKSVPVGDVIALAAHRFRALHDTHELVVEASLPLAVRVDDALLRRALDNLLDNARKYSEPGTTITPCRSGASRVGRTGGRRPSRQRGRALRRPPGRRARRRGRRRPRSSPAEGAAVRAGCQLEPGSPIRYR